MPSKIHLKKLLNKSVLNFFVKFHQKLDNSLESYGDSRCERSLKDLEILRSLTINEESFLSYVKTFQTSHEKFNKTSFGFTKPSRSQKTEDSRNAIMCVIFSRAKEHVCHLDEMAVRIFAIHSPYIGMAFMWSSITHCRSTVLNIRPQKLKPEREYLRFN